MLPFRLTDLNFYCSFLIFLLFLSSCARLPDYATPKLSTHAPNTTSFSYKTLSIKDFRATSPDGISIKNQQHLQARSSIQIKPHASTKIVIIRSTHKGVPLYWGNISDLSFGAFFIPEYSWWNPAVKQRNKKYVLQHEQIHFALMELSARKINEEIKNHREGLPFVENTEKEVQRQLQQWIKNIVQKHQTEILAEHTKFDEDTSLFHSPKTQKKWWHDMEKRLKKTK